MNTIQPKKTTIHFILNTIEALLTFIQLKSALILPKN